MMRRRIGFENMKRFWMQIETSHGLNIALQSRHISSSCKWTLTEINAESPWIANICSYSLNVAWETLNVSGEKDLRKKLSFWATQTYRYTNNWVHPNPHLLQNLKSSISHCHKSIVYGFIYLLVCIYHLSWWCFLQSKQTVCKWLQWVPQEMLDKETGNAITCLSTRKHNRCTITWSWHSTNNLNWHRHVQALSIYDIKLLQQSVGAVPSTLALV